jgi:hypothetical protein
LKGSALFPVIIAGLAPILLLALLASGIGFGLVEWQPPVLWTSTLGGNMRAGDNSVIGVSSDSSGVYSAGYSNYSGVGSPGGSLFISKYDPAGGSVWTHIIGNSSAAVIGISLGTNGIYLVGNSVSPVTGFVEKFDLTGNRLWKTNSSIGKSISATTSGVYIAGYSTIQGFDLNGSLLWTSRIFNVTGGNDGAYSIYADNSGTYVAGGFSGNLTGQTPTGGKDVFLVKYALGGGMIWARQFGTEFDRAYSISRDSTGLYMSGTTYLGALPGFGWLRKFDLSGNLEWTVRIDSPDGSGAGDSSIVADTSGVYVSIVTIASREYLMKYDPQGGQTWSFRMGGSPREIYGVGGAYRLSTTPIILYVAGSLSLSNGPSPSQGFVSRLDPIPSLIFFGVSPPASFIFLGILVGGSAIGLFIFRRLRRGRMPPNRLRPPERHLPATD